MRVKYTITMPTDLVDQPEEFVTAEAVTEMAQALEDAGFAAANVYDHPFSPADWVKSGGHQAVDPFVALSFAAAATERLRLQTNILVATYRNPFITAHSVASLDRLSGGRLILGVAVGYLQPEFEALGVDFHRRGALLDESIDLMRRAWSGEPVEATGPGWVAAGNLLAPLPMQAPYPPIWFGGNSAAAIRRVVSVGQGWMPFPASKAAAERVRTAPMEDLGAMGQAIAQLRITAEKAGRSDPIEVCATPFTHPHLKRNGRFEPDVLVEEVERMAEVGVTWVSIRLPGSDRAEWLENVERFGIEVINRTGA